MAGRTVQAELAERIAAPAPSQVRVTVAQGIPKAQKMDYVVEKLTELGAAAIVPLQSERSLAESGGAHKHERWARIAKSAALQSGRTAIPSIEAPCTLRALLERAGEFDSVIFAWELAPQTSPRAALETALRTARNVLLIIGPEGGFSHEEAALAASAGAHAVWLGPRILRTETAGLVALAFVNLLAEG